MSTQHAFGKTEPFSSFKVNWILILGKIAFLFIILRYNSLNIPTPTIRLIRTTKPHQLFTHVFICIIQSRTTKLRINVTSICTLISRKTFPFGWIVFQRAKLSVWISNARSACFYFWCYLLKGTWNTICGWNSLLY